MRNMTTCGTYACLREEQCDDCFFLDHLKECAYCEHYDHEEAPVSMQKIPIMRISEVMNQIRATAPLRMVWYRSHIVSPTLSSSFMTF